MSDMTGGSASDLIRNLTRQGLSGEGGAMNGAEDRQSVQIAIEQMEKVKRAKKSIDAFLREYPRPSHDMSDDGIMAYTMMTETLGAIDATTKSFIERWEQSAQEILDHRELFLAMKDYGLLIGAASTLYEDEEKIPEIQEWLAHLWIRDYPLGARWAALYNEESQDKIWKTREAAVPTWASAGSSFRERPWRGLWGRGEMKALITGAGRGAGWVLEIDDDDDE